MKLPDPIDNIPPPPARLIPKPLRRLFRLLVLAGLALLASLPGLAQKQKTGKLTVTVLDSATRRQVPVRVRLTQNGKPLKTPPEAAVPVMYGHWDHADAYAFQPDSSFYVNGSFEMTLPPGTYQLTLSKGNEYIRQQEHLQVKAGKTLKKTYRLSRWINMAQRGWYSGDNHIHVRRSPREDPLLMTWIQAEDIHAGVMLKMGDFWETYYAQYAFGEKGVYQQEDYFLSTGQEDPRTPELGHALGIGAAEGVRYKKEYYLYDKVFDRLHALGGITGYAHQAASFHGYRGLMLDGLRHKVDALELLQFCVSDQQPLITGNYYHLLDLGIPVTALAGSDFPWCGFDHEGDAVSRLAQIGNVRFYTYTSKPFSYKTWKEGLAAGHTFVSSGPALELRVNDSLPGTHLNVRPGSTLRIQAQAFGHAGEVPLSKLEIIAHGKVLKQVLVHEAGQSASHLAIDLELPAHQGMWIAARAYGKALQVAHTTPVYVSAGKGFHNPETAPRYLALSEQYLKELEAQLEEESPNPEHQLWHYKVPLKKRINETREVIELLKQKLQ